MHRLRLLPLALLPLCLSAQTPAPSSDSQTLQTLLLEVRQLREDLKLTTVAIERAQILIYRLQSQETAVYRATQRLDDARKMLTEVQTAGKGAAANLKRLED